MAAKGPMRRCSQLAGTDPQPETMTCGRQCRTINFTRGRESQSEVRFPRNSICINCYLEAPSAKIVLAGKPKDDCECMLADNSTTAGYCVKRERCGAYSVLGARLTRKLAALRVRLMRPRLICLCTRGRVRYSVTWPSLHRDS